MTAKLFDSKQLHDTGMMILFDMPYNLVLRWTTMIMMILFDMPYNLVLRWTTMIMMILFDMPYNLVLRQMIIGSDDIRLQ